MKLIINALTKFVLGVILLGILIFLPAGTIAYLGGWLFMGALFVPMLIMGAVMLIKSPSLLEKRLDAKEKRSGQKGIVELSGLIFLGGFLISAFDFRCGWSRVPLWVMLSAAALFLVGYGMYAEVMRENAYLSRTVKVQEGQKVVSTGLYGVVRHPMYLATILMFLPIPLILGSLWGLIPFAFYPVLIAARIADEEKLLEAELDGYTEYKDKVKYKLIPFVW